MNHQEAKQILSRLKLPEEVLSTIKVEVFRLAWLGKGYSEIADETAYDHDYVRKAGSNLWKELSGSLDHQVTKRNFKTLIQDFLDNSRPSNELIPDFPGGIIPVDSPYYIERTSTESRVYDEIKKPGSLLRIRGPKKMGKSSLLLRLKSHVEKHGFAVVIIDLKKADQTILKDLDDFLRWFCIQMSKQLELDVSVDDAWSKITGSKLSCSDFLQDHVLSVIKKPLLLVVEELNLIFDNDSISSDFLSLLRSWYEESRSNEKMSELRMALLYSTEVYVQMDLNLSPFNVGLSVELGRLNDSQVVTLARKYGLDWKLDGTALNPVRKLQAAVSGHPYLIQLALYHLVTGEKFLESPSEKLNDLLEDSCSPGGVFDAFVRGILPHFEDNKDLLQTYKEALCKQNVKLNLHHLYKLESLGLIYFYKGKPEPTSKLIGEYLMDYYVE